MSPPLSHNGGKKALPDRSHDHHAAKADGKGHRMTLAQKLKLCGQQMGVEACINFQQIYTVPILQTLGWQVSVSYYSSLVSGPSALFILPLFGCFVDRENNPHSRKFIASMFAADLQIVGLVTVVVSNLLHLSTSLTIQTSVQGALVILMILFGLLSTAVTGFKQFPQLQETQPRKGSMDFHENDPGADSDLKRYENSTGFYVSAENMPETNLTVGAFESSIRYLGESIKYMDTSVSVVKRTPHSLAEEVPLLEDDSPEKEDHVNNHVDQGHVDRGHVDQGHVEEGHVRSHSVGYGAVHNRDRNQEKTLSGKMNILVEEEEDGRGLLGREKSWWWRRGERHLSCLKSPKVRVGFMCLTTFFSVSAMVTYTFAMSDFVGKVVFGGDPGLSLGLTV
ncbi:hypothetical protein ACOMHN_062512 [Nucella lapillus]